MGQSLRKRGCGRMDGKCSHDNVKIVMERECTGPKQWERNVNDNLVQLCTCVYFVWKIALYHVFSYNYCRYFLAYLLIIVCFDDVTPTSPFLFIEILMSLTHTV